MSCGTKPMMAKYVTQQLTSVAQHRGITIHASSSAESVGSVYQLVTAIESIVMNKKERKVVSFAPHWAIQKPQELVSLVQGQKR